MSKFFVNLGIFILLLLPLTAFSEEEQENIPDWLKRINYGIDIGTDQKPMWYFETVQPLYQTSSKDKTLFIQPRANKQGGDETYNLGFGYRWLTKEDNLLLGVNTFYDYTAEHSHYRIGVGLEAIGKVLEGRLNTYWGLSDKRLIEETTTTKTYEEVIDGLDLEFGGPIIPHIPWLKLYGSGYWFDQKHSDDREGWRIRARLDPIKCVTADIIVWDDNKGDTEFQTDVSVNIAFDTLRDIKQAFKLSNKKYADRDLKKQMLIPVERDWEVKVEKWTESKVGGATIEIKRGN
jgi:hypothetical protein